MSEDINYEEIDELCIPMVKYFNSIGLKTQFSCQGHEGRYSSFDIIFDRCVTDDMICEFLEKHSNQYNHTPFMGRFLKWMRKIDGVMSSNWSYFISYPYCKTNQLYAKMDLEKMLEEED